MVNKFALGAAAGATSLIAAVPLLAQMAGAQSGEAVKIFSRDDMPVPTQECAAAMADMEDARLSTVDSMIELQKQHIQMRRDGLRAIAGIADEAGRKAAMEKMHEDMRATMEAREEGRPAAVATAMEAVKDACGDGMMFHDMKAMKGGMFMDGPHMERRAIKFNLPEKLGMTADELRAALESGKTIEEIAEEKGVELPTRAPRMMHFRNGGSDEDAAQE